ncbi:hypothetical protein ACJA3G_33775, partial [Streptomyces sp. YS-3]
MTQSRQGDEPQQPAARPAHEGVVLPADGSAPWPPGGRPWEARQDGWAQPLPPESGDATQYIAPVPAGAEETQYLTPPPANASDATQYIAPA